MNKVVRFEYGPIHVSYLYMLLSLIKLELQDCSSSVATARNIVPIFFPWLGRTVGKSSSSADYCCISSSYIIMQQCAIKGYI